VRLRGHPGVLCNQQRGRPDYSTSADALAKWRKRRHFARMLMRSSSRAARLVYGPNGFRLLATGDHVVCAVTGIAIPLEELRYWSVDRQEAYASPAAATQAITGRTPPAC
jgi:hypothetical protein